MITLAQYQEPPRLKSNCNICISRNFITHGRSTINQATTQVGDIMVCNFHSEYAAYMTNAGKRFMGHGWLENETSYSGGE